MIKYLKIKNYLPRRFGSTSLWIILCAGLGILLLGSCKKKMANEEDSASTLKFFKGSYNDKVAKIEKTSDGGFIYCGFTQSGSKVDAFMMRVDANGKQLWYHTFGGPNFDEFRSVIQTSDGGFLGVGTSNSFGQALADSTINHFDYVVKVNANGIEEWGHSYCMYAASLNGVIELPNHKYAITGGIVPYSETYIYFCIVNPDGSLYKSNFYPYYGYNYANDLYFLPPNKIDKYYNFFGISLALTNDDSIMVVGVMNKSGLNTEAHTLCTFYLKVGLNGNLRPGYFYPYYQYVRKGVYQYSWPGHTRRYPPITVFKKTDGYMFLTYIEPSDNSGRMQIFKTDLAGDVLWEKEYSGLNTAFYYNVEVNPDGNMLLVGMSTTETTSSGYPELFANSKVMLMLVDPEGNEIWEQYTGSDVNVNIAKCAQAAPGGGWNVAGYSTSNETGYDKMFVIKVDQSGKLITK